MQFQRRRDWKWGRSVIKGRSRGGQVVLKKFGPEAGEDTFLVRIGKDAARQVTGAPADARAALSELREELEGGEYQPTRTTRLDRFLTQVFLPWKRRALKPKTYGEYQRIIVDRICPALGHHFLQGLTEETIWQWVDDMWDEGLSRKTIREYFVLLRAALKRAQRKGLIRTNPAADVSPTQRRGEESWLLSATHGLGGEDDEHEGVDLSRVWTAAEVTEFVDKSDPSSEVVRWIRFGLGTGLRPQEACGLRWGDTPLGEVSRSDAGPIRVMLAVCEVDPDRRHKHGRWILSEPKTGKRQLVPDKDALEMLRLQKQALVREGLPTGPTDFVFPCRGGDRPYNNPCNMKNRQGNFLRNHPSFRQIPPYGQRHTHATLLLDRGWGALHVAKRLGTGLDMIMHHYGHLLPETERDMLRGFGGSNPVSVNGSDQDPLNGQGHQAA